MEHIEKVKEMCRAADAEKAERLREIKNRKGGNRVFWINGADRWNHDSLEMLIDNARRSHQEEAKALQDQIDKCRTKTIKGNTYWYQWSPEKGDHIYRGKEDPRPPLKQKLKKLREAQQANLEKMRSCVVKKIDKHYVIDLVKYQEHVQKRLRSGMILVSEVLA